MTSAEIALTFSLHNTRDIPSRSKRLRNGINNVDLQLIVRHQSTLLIRSSVCQRMEFPKRTMISGRRSFFLPSPSPFPSFALAPTIRVTIFTTIFHCHKIKEGGYNNITISPTQNTPALQASAMLCYVIEHMLCYIAYVMLYNICHVMVYNMCHVMLYNMCHVLLCNMCHVMLNNMCHVMLYNICHVMSCYIT